MTKINETVNESIDNFPMTFSEAGVILLLSITMSVVTIGGNILVLFSFYIEPALRISTNYFIASLAVTDLLIGVISMNLYTAYIIMGYWPLGELLCDLWLSMDYTACLTSQYTVFLITVDRYCSIKMPMRYHKWRSEKIICIMIFLTWLIPSLVFYSIIMGWKYTVRRERHLNECYAEFSIRPVFITVLTVCYFWSTLIVMIILYIGIYRVALDLQRKSDARKAKVNKYLLISLSSKPSNSPSCQDKTDSFASKDDDLPSHASRDIETDNLKNSQSSCFVLYPGQLPNVRSPIIDDVDSLNCDFRNLIYDLVVEPPNQRVNNETKISHHHYVCNLHFHSSTMLCLHPKSYCDVPGVEFIDIEDFESSFNISGTSSSGNLQDSRAKLFTSPIWEENKKVSNGNTTTEKNLSNQINEEASSAANKSPLVKLGTRFQGIIQKSKDKQFSMNRNRNRAKKALKMISLILGAFIICWTPFHIVILIKAACDDHITNHSCMNVHVYRLAYWLCYINSPLNPFCYALSNAQIKETFFRILTCKIKSR